MLATPSVTQERLDPRIKRTRKLIQEAFVELLAEKGFRALTVQDIAERAEINRATFYAHFPDKFALLEETIRSAFRSELEKRTLEACCYSEANLRALIETVCEFVAGSSKRCKVSENQFETLVEAQVKKQIQEMLVLWLDRAGSRIDPGMAATSASWAMYGLALKWSREKNRPPAEDYAEEVLPLIAANLRLAGRTVAS